VFLNKRTASDSSTKDVFLIELSHNSNPANNIRNKSKAWACANFMGVA